MIFLIGISIVYKLISFTHTINKDNHLCYKIEVLEIVADVGVKIVNAVFFYAKMADLGNSGDSSSLYAKYWLAIIFFKA